jgi:hypothetical protein
MKIELKKLHINERFSEETTMFQADVYINGEQAAYANNDGHGGCTFYHPYEGKRGLIEQAEAYCKTLPKGKLGDFEYEITLEGVIDDLVHETLKAKHDAKFNKKLQKDMLKGVCVKTEMGYSLITWKGFTLVQLLSNPNGRTAVYNKIRELKAEGKQVLNTNVPSNL